MKHSEDLEKMDKFAMITNTRRRRNRSFVPASQAPPAKKKNYHFDLTNDSSEDCVWLLGLGLGLGVLFSFIYLK